MKTLCLLIIFVCSTWARPQYSGGANQGFGQQQIQGDRNPSRPTSRPSFLPAGCRIEYKTVFSVEEREEYENKCRTLYRQECQQKFQRICNPYREKQCKTEYQQKCQTLQKEECNQSWRDVQEEYTEDECNDNYVRKCEKHWEQAADGSKVWADNPTTCKDLKETKCSPVTKYRNVRQPYTKCDQVPYQDCKNVPWENCNWVNREKCENEPYQDCNDVPYQDCQKVHKLVPHQVSKRRPFRVCNNKDPYEFTDDEINQFDILEIRSGSTDEDADEEFDEQDDVEEVDTKKLEPEEVTTKKSSSAIIFGGQ